MIDIHAHILPFIDDGAVSWEEAVEMCNMAYDDGIRVIVATPHIMDGLKKNDIVKKVEELRERIEVPLSILWGGGCPSVSRSGESHKGWYNTYDKRQKLSVA